MPKQFNGKTVGNYVLYTAERARANAAALQLDTTFAFGNGGGQITTFGATNASTISHGPVAMFSGTILAATLGIWQSSPTPFSSGRFALRVFYGNGGFTTTDTFSLTSKQSGDTLVLNNIDRDIGAGYSFNFICTEALPSLSNYVLSLTILVRYNIPPQNSEGYPL